MVTSIQSLRPTPHSADRPVTRKAYVDAPLQTNPHITYHKEHSTTLQTTTRYVREGWNIPEIAKSLQFREETIQNHVCHILRVCEDPFSHYDLRRILPQIDDKWLLETHGWLLDEKSELIGEAIGWADKQGSVKRVKADLPKLIPTAASGTVSTAPLIPPGAPSRPRAKRLPPPPPKLTSRVIRWLHNKRPLLHLCRAFVDFLSGMTFSDISYKEGIVRETVRVYVLTVIDEWIDHIPRGAITAKDVRRLLLELNGEKRDDLHCRVITALGKHLAIDVRRMELDIKAKVTAGNSKKGQGVISWARVGRKEGEKAVQRDAEAADARHQKVCVGQKRRASQLEA